MNRYRVTYKPRNKRKYVAAYFENFEEAVTFAKVNKGLIYATLTGALVGNFTEEPATGYAEYVIGIK